MSKAEQIRIAIRAAGGRASRPEIKASVPGRTTGSHIGSMCRTGQLGHDGPPGSYIYFIARDPLIDRTTVVTPEERRERLRALDRVRGARRRLEAGAKPRSELAAERAAEAQRKLDAKKSAKAARDAAASERAKAKAARRTVVRTATKRIAPKPPKFAVPIEPPSGITTRVARVEVPRPCTDEHIASGGAYEILPGPACTPAWLARAA